MVTSFRSVLVGPFVVATIARLVEVIMCWLVSCCSSQAGTFTEMISKMWVCTVNGCS